MDQPIQEENANVAELRERIRALEEQLEELSPLVGRDAIALGLLSGDLDKVLAAFIIAQGAAAYDTEVDMFFAFWATAALRDPNKKKVAKGLTERAFGFMLPEGASRLPLSRLNFAGVGPRIMKGLMREKGVMDLGKMIDEAASLGVRIHICEMSMDLMGFKREEMIEYPGLDYIGVGSFLDMARTAKQAFFL